MNKVLLVPIVFILFVCLFLMYVTGGEYAKAAATGIGTSVVASFIYAVINTYFETGLRDVVSKLKFSISATKDIAETLSNISTKGVVDVRSKYNEKSSFWFSILSESKISLDMIGNSLTEWCAPDYRDIFKDHLIRIARAGGRIRIVIMNPVSDVSEQKRGVFEKKYKEACEKFIAIIREAHAECVRKKLPGSLSLYLTADYLTYMLIISDEKLYVSPYMTRKKSTHPIVLAITRDSQFAGGYRADFDEIVRNSAMMSLDRLDANSGSMGRVGVESE